MPFRPTLLAALLPLVAGAAAAADLPAPNDPYWTLIHDQAVDAELKLTPAQRKAWWAALDPLDLKCFPYRNKPAAEADAGCAAILADAKQQLGKVLQPRQVQRLEQIVLRIQGTDALLREDIATQLKLTDKQRADIGKAIGDSREARNKLQRDLLGAKLEAAKADDEAKRLSAAERAAVLGALTDEQKSRFTGLLAKDFDPAKLGRTLFKTPDLVGDGQAWLNSQPIAADSLRGRVVVVHFFAFGCINCIHNYPSYRKWQEELLPKGVKMIGIHTPETQGEHNVETLKGKLKAERLEFPVIVDNDKANWNVWGNSMWPAVYLLDKRGYLRAHWPGELKWQGRDGEAQMEKQINSLLAEPGEYR
jgi:thiol-disulfide isomerase/thioredoxin